MPYTIVKMGKGYAVETKGTGKKHSNHPLSHKMAERQMKALYYVMKNMEMKK
jgi:hypothetical protein